MTQILALLLLATWGTIGLALYLRQERHKRDREERRQAITNAIRKQRRSKWVP